MAKTRVNMRIDEGLWARVRAFAASRGRTVTSVVEEALVGEFGGIPVAPSAEERIEQSRSFEGQPGFTSEGHPVVMQGGVSGALKPVYVAASPVDDAVVDAVIKINDSSCPYTAKQLQGRTGLPLSACQRHIDKGTWKTLL